MVLNWENKEDGQPIQTTRVSWFFCRYVVLINLYMSQWQFCSISINLFYLCPWILKQELCQPFFEHGIFGTVANQKASTLAFTFRMQKAWRIYLKTATDFLINVHASRNPFVRKFSCNQIVMNDIKYTFIGNAQCFCYMFEPSFVIMSCTESLLS